MSREINSHQLVKSIFFEAAPVSEAELQMKPELKSEKSGKLAGVTDQKAVGSMLSDLKGILSKLGLKDLDSRLKVDMGGFKLSCDKEQHTADSDVLFDLSKIGSLIDKGFAVLDAEADGANSYSIIILASDSMPDFDLPDADDPEAVEFDNGESKFDSVNTTKLAEELVRKVTGRK